MDYYYFEPNDTIDERIRCNDVDALRGILVGIINRDPTFATKRYEEALNYIIDRGLINIYDDRGNIKLPGEYEVETNGWNKEYYRKLLAWLSQNYTKERVKYIKQVGAKVYGGEYTQGKDEAENFLHPATQNQMTHQKGWSAVGGIIILIALVLIIIVVWLGIQMLGDKFPQIEKNTQTSMETELLAEEITHQTVNGVESMIKGESVLTQAEEKLVKKEGNNQILTTTVLRTEEKN